MKFTRALAVGGLATALTAGVMAPANAAVVSGRLHYSAALSKSHKVKTPGYLSARPIAKIEVSYVTPKHRKGVIKVQAFAPNGKALGPVVELRRPNQKYTLASKIRVHGFRLTWSPSVAGKITGWEYFTLAAK